MPILTPLISDNFFYWSRCDTHTEPIFKELKFLKKEQYIRLLQLGQFMHSFRTGIWLLIIVFIVTTQGTSPFFGYLFTGQT